MSWRKLGRIFVPDGSQPWARSGAQLPTAERISDKAIRVYFASKDGDGFGRIGYVDVDSRDPTKLLDIGLNPLLELGELGSFDDCGVVPNFAIEFRGRHFLYYQGFQRTVRVPYLTFTGLATRNAQEKEFTRYRRTPITERTAEEPFIRSTPCILAQGSKLRMYYVTTTKWTEDRHGMHYFCVIKHATSEDGIDWDARHTPCIEPTLDDEYAVGRPAVVYDGSVYKMWYSIRSFSQLYTIGYAESDDGLTWTRRDSKTGLSKSKRGWDAEMVCYPNIIEVDGQHRLMFYNGNGRGLSGFGCAIWE